MAASKFDYLRHRPFFIIEIYHLPRSGVRTERKGWARVVDYCARPRLLIGASVFRIVAGLGILYQYLINYEQRRYLFGPDGVMPFTDGKATSWSYTSL